MQYHAHITEDTENKQWKVLVDAVFPDAVPIPPAFYKLELDAVNAVCKWLRDGTPPKGDEADEPKE